MELYISDMDGTLLDTAGQMPKQTREILRELLGQGLLFTVASARTPLSAIPLLEGLELTVPAVLMSGALIYDMKADCFLDITCFDEREMEMLQLAEQRTGSRGFLISEKSGRLFLNLSSEAQGPWTGYFSLEALNDKASIDTCVRTADALRLSRDNLIYGLYMDQKPDRLAEMTQILQQESCFLVDFYQDRYRPSCWCVELMSRSASKKRGVRLLRKLYPEARLIGFGDGKNDFSLFEACDEAYAVSNACRELLEQADGILENSQCNGVVNYIRKRWEKNEADLSGKSLPAEYGV